MARVALLPIACLAIVAAVPPSRDPFYAVQGGLNRINPGTILNHRKTPSPIGSYGLFLNELQSSYQVLYRTTDHQGNATATVLTVLVPPNASFDKVLSFQVSEDSATIDCAPSYGVQLQTTSDTLLSCSATQLELRIIETALRRCWVVISPDSEGPKGAYPPSKLHGHAVLDGLRAAAASGPFTGIKPSPRMAMWGYSTGAVVTQVAAELQPGYAPELEIAGAALGGLGSNATLQDYLPFNKRPLASFILINLLGPAAQYPEIGELIDRHLKPQYRDLFYQSVKQCLDANLITYANTDVVAMFADPSILNNISLILIDKIRKDGQRNAIPGIPLFWYHYAFDFVTQITAANAVVSKYCAKGVTVEYLIELASKIDHSLFEVVGATYALSWLEGVLNGTVPHPRCSSKTILTKRLDRRFIRTFPNFIIEEISLAGISVD